MPDSSPISSGETALPSLQPSPDAGCPDGAETADRIKHLAREAGFDLCRITSATPLHRERARYLTWLAEGRHGAMQWMTPERAHRSTDPATTLSAARSIICLGMAYWAGHRTVSPESSGKVARYAW